MASEPPVPPWCDKRPRSSTHFGDTRVDDYGWLREREDPEVRAHLIAERDHAEAVIDGRCGDLRERLYAEMRARIKEDDQGVPSKDGPWLYYSRTEAGDEYPRHCRRAWAAGREHMSLAELERSAVAEQVYLDENQLAEGCDYFDLACLSISPNHRLCAYAVDTRGDEIYTVFIKDLDSGELLEDRIEGCGGELAWGDDATLFYDRLDPAHRSFQAWRHGVGAPTEDDVLLWQEDDERYFLSIYRTRSEAYVVLSVDSHVSSELRLIPTAAPRSEPVLVAARAPEVEYELSHRGDALIVATNAEAQNFRLMVAPLPDPATPAGEEGSPRSRWRELIPHRDEVLIEGFDLFAEQLVVWERWRGLERCRVVPLGTLGDPLPARAGAGEVPGEHLIEFPDPAYSIWSSSNPEFASPRLRFGYTSLTTPATIYDYDLRTRAKTLRKRAEVVGGHEPGDYASARIFATAEDGERVPISLVWRRADGGLDAAGRLEAPRPLILYGYGAYGVSSDPGFSSARLSLLRRGVVWAIAHVRGGGELGRRWWEAGKLEHKHNSFDDFIACAEQLIAEGWTSAEQLVGWGGSAGGLLIGAVANARPELFAALVADVPFVDVLDSILDESLPLAVIEREEWGDPTTAEGYAWIRAYSPYDNVRAQAYPSMLVLAGWNDPRVGYWEAAKWVARLRERKTDAREILLWTNMDAGHAGASGRFEFLRELALEYAFLIARLGLPRELSASPREQP